MQGSDLYAAFIDAEMGSVCLLSCLHAEVDWIWVETTGGEHIQASLYMKTNFKVILAIVQKEQLAWGVMKGGTYIFAV
jgi:hypothetical protein